MVLMVLLTKVLKCWWKENDSLIEFPYFFFDFFHKFSIKKKLLRVGVYQSLSPVGVWGGYLNAG